jgi:hypothetical protein
VDLEVAVTDLLAVTGGRLVSASDRRADGDIGVEGEVR